MKITKLNESIRTHTLYLEEELLTELKPLSSKGIQRLVNKQIKRNEKEQIKNNRNYEKLIAQDLSPENGKALIYIAKPDGKYEAGKPQKDVKHLYNKGNLLIPELANAMVVDSNGLYVRRGLEDLSDTPTRPDNVNNLSQEMIKQGYTLDWPEVDKTEPEDKTNDDDGADKKTDAIDNTVTDEKSTKDTSDDTPEDTSDKTATVHPEISDKVLSKFKKLVYATGIKLYDAFDKPLQYNNIQDLDKLTQQTIWDYEIDVKGRKHRLGDWLKKAVKAKIITEEFNNETLDKVLSESPELIFKDAELNDPRTIDLKSMIADRQAEEDDRLAHEAKLAKMEEFRTKYSDVLDTLHDNIGEEDPTDTLQKLFSILVPSEGMCDTVGGEHIRAMMRILYRDYNDGDKFFEGYGLETCGSSAEYLLDNTSDAIYKFISQMVEESWKYEDDDAYTTAIKHITELLLDYLNESEDLFFTPNDTDSREYDADWITENQPTYEFEFYVSDDVDMLIDEGYIDSWELNSYVENQLEYANATAGCVVERPWGQHDKSVTVTNLTRDGYDYCKDQLFSNPDGFWEDLVQEHADDLSSIMDDSEDEDVEEDSFEEEE